jgi:hypothetical protein
VQEARKMYEDSCQAVSGENNYIWQFSFFHILLQHFQNVHVP